MKVTLHDQSGNGDSLDIEVINHGDAVLIKAEGYGDCVSEDDCGTPIAIELYDGKLRVIAWADINREDYTDIIDLSGAKIENRKVEGFINHYECDCGNTWSVEWSCTCDDECPSCGKSVSPHQSEDTH